MYYKKNSAFLIFGEQLNKIIACLHLLLERNVNNKGLNKFIKQLEDIKPYEELLDEYIEDSEAAKVISNLKVDSMEQMLNDLGLTLKRDDK
jgi:hypothetical protein|tara:strand:- start:715 stop:987 length:273 start_codon:yes stop_codon:yes gene_type:complete